jgi:hypothetical protein
MGVLGLTECSSPIRLPVESQECATDPAARYLGTDGEWKGGVRPSSVIETLADLEWLLSHRETPRPQVVCRWCGSTTQPPSLAAAARWWTSHPCAKGLAA